MDNQIAVVENTVNTLTSIERTNLVELEDTIQKNLSVFYEVGFALMQIRDNELYRETHGTFELYCKERWGFNSSRARQLISAAVVNDNLKGVTMVTLNERQARVLAPLSPEQQREVFQKAVDASAGGMITAKDLEGIAQAVKPVKISQLNNQPTKHTDLPRISTSFKAACDMLNEEIKKENLNGWKETSKKDAIDFINILLTNIA